MRRVLLAAPLVLVFLASPSPAAAQSWVVSPASDATGATGQLFWITLVLATIVFILIEGLLIASSLRFRRHSLVLDQEPPQLRGNARLEVMWAAMPALILVGLFGITVSRLGDLTQIPTNPNALHISVTGRQFSWEFDYPSGVKTTNDLHLPTGTPLIFDVTSMDVIHSFWVPDLYGKVDANPGRVSRISYTANQPGTYRGVCAELCGSGHAGMMFSVTVQSPSDFQTWLQQQAAAGTTAAAPGAPAPAPAAQPGAAPAASPVPSPAVAVKPSASPAASAVPSPGVAVKPSASPAASAVPAPGAPAPAPAPCAPPPAGGDLAAQGAMLIPQKGCPACHTIPGIPGANGTIGPNLGGVASRTTIAGGVVPNNGPDDLKRWIMMPNVLKPGTQMPNLGLSDAEATAIVAYLETLK